MIIKYIDDQHTLIHTNNLYLMLLALFLVILLHLLHLLLLSIFVLQSLQTFIHHFIIFENTVIIDDPRENTNASWHLRTFEHLNERLVLHSLVITNNICEFEFLDFLYDSLSTRTHIHDTSTASGSHISHTLHPCSIRYSYNTPFQEECSWLKSLLWACTSHYSARTAL